MATPADESPSYLAYLNDQYRLVNFTNGKVGEITIQNPDGFEPKYSSIPSVNDSRFNNLNEIVFKGNEGLNPFNNFNQKNLISSLGCIFLGGQNIGSVIGNFANGFASQAQNLLSSALPSFLPPVLPSLGSIFNINIFNSGIKRQAILPKSGGFLSAFGALGGIAGVLTNIVQSYVNQITNPVSSFLKEINKCIRND